MHLFCTLNQISLWFVLGGTIGKSALVQVLTCHLSHLPLVLHIIYASWTGSTLVRIMACHLGGTGILNQCWNIVNWTLRNKSLWNFNQNSYIFIQENAFENVVCNMWRAFCPGKDESTGTKPLPAWLHSKSNKYAKSFHPFFRWKQVNTKYLANHSSSKISLYINVFKP